MVTRCSFTICTALLCIALPPTAPAASWQDLANRGTLTSAGFTARVQGGFLYELQVAGSGEFLVQTAPASLTAVHPIFGTVSLNLAAANVTLSSTGTNLAYSLSFPDGTAWAIDWSLQGSDLVLRTDATRPGAVEMFTFPIEGCRIATRDLVMVDHNGTGHVFENGWTGTFGDPNRSGMPQSAVQPMVALFQGATNGWAVEGRDLELGPSIHRAFGGGSDAEIYFSHGFMHQPTSAPDMFEIRFRLYSGAWQDAVDPYLDWMENDAGFVPLSSQSPAWVDDIRRQAYVTVTDYAGLNDLAANADPAETFLGRQAEYRYFIFDQNFPDYEPTPTSVTWIQAARAHGFHVGVHVNIAGIDRDDAATIAQFEPGLLQVGTDGMGNPIYDGASTHVYCSAAYPPWRTNLVQAISNVVAAGADIIYLDQSTAPIGKFFIDGVTGIEGVQLLMQEIKAAYPGVAIQTEQFNPMASKEAAFALTTLDPGHPLSGYIFSRFVKVVPEGYYYQPIDVPTMDQFMEWGHFVPGASNNESWMEIAGAFEQFDLAPDSRLPRAANQLSGFSGPGGVTGFFERNATDRAFVVYEPAQPPHDFGTRYENITSWPGPGGLADWLLYSGSTLIGLDPDVSYLFDPGSPPDPNRFHVFAIPPDFLPYRNDTRKIVSQEIGVNETNFRVFFTGHGTMSAFVEDEYDLFLDGVPIPVNRALDTATFPVSANTGDPSELLAFQQTEQVLTGSWVNLSWSRPQHKVSFVSTQDSLFADSFFVNVTGTAFLNGRFPAQSMVRATGFYKIRDNVVNSTADAVLKVNGQEMMRLDPGAGPPYAMIPFDVNLTAFAGEYVFVEFTSDGDLHGPDATDWIVPKFIVTGIGPPHLPIVSHIASTEHGSRKIDRTYDDSGMAGDSGSARATNDTHSTDVINHIGLLNGDTPPLFIEYDLGQSYALSNLVVWNDNEPLYYSQGMKAATIEVRDLGGPATPVFSGDIPFAPAQGSGPTTASLDVDLTGMTGRFVRFTTGPLPNHSWRATLDGVTDDVACGLSEVRIYGNPTGLGNPGDEACCLPDGTCVMTSPSACLAAGGTPQGPSSNCGAHDCSAATTVASDQAVNVTFDAHDAVRYDLQRATRLNPSWSNHVPRFVVGDGTASTMVGDGDELFAFFRLQTDTVSPPGPAIEIVTVENTTGLSFPSASGTVYELERASRSTPEAVGGAATNGWDQTPAVTQASADVEKTSGGWLGLAVNLVNGNGVFVGGQFHANSPGATYPGPGNNWWAEGDPGVTLNPGTVPGNHWVRFDLDQVYPLIRLEVWNYNESAYTAYGMKDVVIEISETGGAGSIEWSTIFSGVIPQASGSAAEPVNLVVDLPAVRARHVVITGFLSHGDPLGRGPGNILALSEVRLYTTGLPIPVESAQFQGSGAFTAGDGATQVLYDPDGFSTNLHYRVVPR